MTKTHIYINGRVVPGEKATVSVFDRGFAYGDGLFETLKAYNGKAAFVTEHLQRLKRGARLIGIPQKALSVLEKEIKAGLLEKILEKNKLTRQEAYIKIIVTRGVDRGGHSPLKPPIDPTVVIVTKRIDTEEIERRKKRGVSAVTVAGVFPALPGIKTLNYLPNVLGKAVAAKKGAFEGIFIGPDGFMREGTSFNVFAVKNRAIKTPPLGKNLTDGVLPGVTRGKVIQVARREQMAVRESRVSLRELLQSDEVFITNSVFEVLPVLRVDSKRIGSGKPGPVTRLVQEGYLRLVRGETVP